MCDAAPFEHGCLDRYTRADPRLAGAGAASGGFSRQPRDADGMATRSVKACSAYATRLIANGRVGGLNAPKDRLGRLVGNPPIGATAAEHVRRGTPLGVSLPPRGVALERAAREETRVAENCVCVFRKNAALARSSCASTNKAGSSLSSGGADRRGGDKKSFRGAAEKAMISVRR